MGQLLEHGRTTCSESERLADSNDFLSPLLPHSHTSTHPLTHSLLLVAGSHLNISSDQKYRHEALEERHKEDRQAFVTRAKLLENGCEHSSSTPLCGSRVSPSWGECRYVGCSCWCADVPLRWIRYKSKLTLSDFNIDRTLGEGAFGRVVLATVKAGTHKWDKKNDTFVAIKCLEKQQVLEESQVEHTTNEKNLLFCLDCPMIAKFFDFMVDKENSEF